MEPTSGIIWGIKPHVGVTLRATKKAGVGEPFFTLHARDFSGAVTFGGVKADILTYLCSHATNWVNKQALHSLLVLKPYSKRDTQLITEIIVELEGMPGASSVLVETKTVRLKKVSLLEPNRKSSPRYGVWKIPVLEAEFFVERKWGEVRVWRRDLSPIEKAQLLFLEALKGTLPVQQEQHLAEALEQLDPHALRSIVFGAESGVRGAIGVRDDAVGEMLRAAIERCRIPQQLPARPAQFVGRSEDLRTISQLSPLGGPAVVGICGMPGAGKTTLAVVLANEWKTRFPDAQIFLQMGGSNGKFSNATQVLLNVIHALRPEARFLIGSAPLENRRTELEGIYRDTLALKRVLIVLDNVPSADEVKSLIPPSGSGLIFTSRSRFLVAGNTPHIVGRMNDEDALELLRGLYPPLSEREGRALVELCTGLPLAMRIAGAQLALEASDRGCRAAVVSYLEKLQRSRLEALDHGAADAGEVSVSESLRLSEAELGPEHSKMWHRLGVFRGSFDLQAAGAVSGVSEDFLTLLVRRSLLERFGDRYQLHDLVRDYVLRRLDERQPELHQAQLNHATHYLSVLVESNRLHSEGGNSVQSALLLFDGEWPNIELGQSWAQDHMVDAEPIARLCIAYPTAGSLSLSIRVHPRIQIEWLKTATKGFKRLETPTASDLEKEALLLHNLGLALSQLGEMVEAIQWYEQSLLLIEWLDNPYYESICRANCGWAYYKSDQQAKARSQYELGLIAASKIEDASKKSEARANALINIGLSFKDAGEFALALEHYESSLVEVKAIGNRRLEGNVLGNIGNIYLLTNQYTQALRFFDQQNTIAGDMKDKRGRATARYNSAQCLQALGETGEAIKMAEEALNLYQSLDDPMATGVNEDLNAWRSRGAYGRS